MGPLDGVFRMVFFLSIYFRFFYFVVGNIWFGENPPGYAMASAVVDTISAPPGEFGRRGWSRRQIDRGQVMDIGSIRLSR